MASKPPRRVPRKANFVQELLTRQPNANLKEANEAWKRRGNQDGIGNSLFYRVKAQVAATGAEPGPGRGKTERSVDTGSESRPHATGRSASHESSLDQLESQIDELMFKAREAGGLQEVENALRQARRLVVRKQSS